MILRYETRSDEPECERDADVASFSSWDSAPVPLPVPSGDLPGWVYVAGTVAFVVATLVTLRLFGL